MPAAATVAVRRDSIPVCIPLMLWVDGQEPETAVSARVCVVSRKCARVRLKDPLPVNTAVRLKLAARSRSAAGTISAVFSAPTGEAEIAVFGDSIGSYLGVAFPDTDAVAAEAARPAAPPPPAAAVPVPEPLPATTPRSGRPITRDIQVLVQGKDARGIFSETVKARLDATGCFDLALPRELSTGVLLRVVATDTAQEQEWLCNVSYRGIARNADGTWEYRLSF